jgi:hypothetical protein
MRKLVSTILLLLAGAAAPLIAQTSSTPFPVPIYYASAFGGWSLNGQSPNTFTFAGRSLCNGSAQNTTFFVFNTNAPVWIADQNTANSETVTPSAVVNTAGSCGVSVAPANQHYTFQLKSGTGGLQEAINTVQGAGAYPAVIALDRNWFAQANAVPGTNALSIITAAAGGAGAILEDITAAPTVNYVWSGTAYAKASWVNTAPTPAAGAGAGSSPTIALAGGSSALSGIVNLTTGTATTTGTLFTLTWVTNTLTYAGTCVVTSVGTNAYTTFTEATTAPGSLRLSTVTVATTAPTASTAYKFAYICK